MTLSEKSIFGFLETVIQLLKGERDALAKAGWDVDGVIASLESILDAAVTANETQETAKRKAKEATTAFLAIKQHAYLTASGCLDMAIAAVGKTSDAAKNLRRYRARARRRPTDATAPAPVSPSQAP